MQVLRKPQKRRDAEGKTKWQPRAEILNYLGKIREEIEGKTKEEGFQLGSKSKLVSFLRSGECWQIKYLDRGNGYYILYIISQFEKYTGEFPN